MTICIIPLGESCNITFLLQNAGLKKETSLFEWFVSRRLSDITTVLLKIATNTDQDIIKQVGQHTYIENGNIFSGHYTTEDFKSIYERRRNRLIETIRTESSLLFIRFEGTKHIYTYKEIDDFIDVIRRINPDCSIQILLIHPEPYDLEHPCLIRKIYDKHGEDLYCRGQPINTFFVDTLHTIGVYK
jgi:hypothetical protein